MSRVVRLVIALATVLVGCVEENPTLSPTTTVAPSPVPEAAVALVNETTVKVRWKPSPSEQLPAFQEYYLVLVEMATQRVVRRLAISERRPEYIIELSGLRQGTLYGLDIWIRFKDNTLSTAPRTLLFAPAIPYTAIAGQPIRLYEQDAQAQPNGLNFSMGGMPALLTQAFAAQWDLCFEIVDGQAYIGSPRGSRAYVGEGKPLQPGTGRRTLVGSTVITDVDSLEDVWVSAPLDTSAGRLDTVMLPIPERLASGKGLAFFLMRVDTTWAKIFIKPGSDGRLIQGEAPQRYVELHLSYQPAKAIPSALPYRDGRTPALREGRAWVH